MCVCVCAPKPTGWVSHHAIHPIARQWSRDPINLARDFVGRDAFPILRPPKRPLRRRPLYGQLEHLGHLVAILWAVWLSYLLVATVIPNTSTTKNVVLFSSPLDTDFHRYHPSTNEDIPDDTLVAVLGNIVDHVRRFIYTRALTRLASLPSP